MGILIDNAYWELGLKADQLKSEAIAVEQADDRIAASAQRAEDALTALVEEMLQTADGAAGVQRFIEQLSAATDEVTAGMSRAASGSAKFDQGLRRLEQQQAEAAIRAAELARPVDAVAARMGLAASGTAKWEEGLRRLRVQQQEQAVQAGAFVAATDGFTKGANRAHNALVSLAWQGTQTGGAVGKLIEGMLLFGAGSTVVLGVAAGVAVIATAYRKITEEARKTKEAADQAREAVSASLAARAGRLPEIFDLEAKLRKEQKALTDRRDEAVGVERGTGVIRTRGLTPEEQAELDEIGRRLNDLAAERARIAGEKREAVSDAAAVTRDLALQISLLDQAIRLRREHGVDTTDLVRERDDVAKVLAGVKDLPADQQEEARAALEAGIAARKQALEQIRQELTARFTAVLPATVEATASAIHTLSLRLIEAGATPKELADNLEPLITQLAALKAQADQVDIDQALSLGPEQALEALDRLRSQRVAQLSPTQDTANDLRLLAEIKALDDARAKVNLQIWEAYRKQADATGDVLDNTLETSTAVGRTKATTAQIVQQVADIARGAIGVAQAFGLASDSTAALLQNLVTVADTLPGVIDQVNKIGKNDPDTGKPLFDPAAFAAGLTGVLGGLAGIASSLFGGESPAARRAREISQENTEAIRTLSEEIGNLDLNIRGRDFAAGQRGVEVLLGGQVDIVRAAGRLDRDAADRLLRGQGSSFRELQELARGLGITLNTDSVIHFVQSLRELQEAIAATEIAQFAETFAGQMQALNDEFALFDITDPLEQLEKLQELSQQTDRNGELLGSPAIAKALKDLDLSTQAGRNEAEARLQELLRQARAGELTAEGLGLSLEEFRDLLKQIEGLIDDVNKDRGTQTGGGPVQETFGEFRGLTEETGSVIGGRLLSLDIHVLEGVGYQREMRDILARVFTATGPVPVPVLPATATAPGGLTVVIEQLVLPTTTDPSPAGLQTAGAAVGAGLLESLDQHLGSRYRLKQLLIGQTRVT